MTVTTKSDVTQDMKLYDKFVNRFQDISQEKNPAVSKAKLSHLLTAFKRKCFGEYDAVILTAVYLKVFLDMVSQIS